MNAAILRARPAGVACRLGRRRSWLTLIAAMAVVTPVLTRALGGSSGYLASLAVYWVGFCLPVAIIHVRRARFAKLFVWRLPSRDLWVLPVLAIQVAAVAVFGVLLHSHEITLAAAALALCVALINGPLEELAWRGGFFTVFGNLPRFGFWIGLALFTAALAFSVLFQTNGFV